MSRRVRLGAEDEREIALEVHPLLLLAIGLDFDPFSAVRSGK